MTLFRHMNCVVVLLIWGILIYPLVCVDGFAVNRWAPMRFKLRSTAETSVPPEIARCSAANDLILVERLSAPLATSEGLYIPSVEGKDDMRLGRVLSVPEGQFAVSEKALIPTAKAAPYSIGDIVFIRDAWGIGPLHIQLGRRYFSFHKLDHILGKVTTQGK